MSSTTTIATTTTFLSRKMDKKIKGKQMKKRKSFKAETIKRLSPMSKCYCFRLSRAFKIQKLLLSTNYGGSTFHGPSTYEIHLTDPLLGCSFQKMLIIVQTSKCVHVTLSIHEHLIFF